MRTSHRCVAAAGEEAPCGLPLITRPASQDSSNTHFSLFHFRKTALDRARVARLIDDDVSDDGEALLEALIATGPQVLKPCLYKRR